MEKIKARYDVGDWYLYDIKDDTNYISYHTKDEKDTLIIKKYEDSDDWHIKVSTKGSGRLELLKRVKTLPKAKSYAISYMEKHSGRNL